jgi:hypothetical protein
MLTVVVALSMLPEDSTSIAGGGVGVGAGAGATFGGTAFGVTTGFGLKVAGFANFGLGWNFGLG